MSMVSTALRERALVPHCPDGAATLASMRGHERAIVSGICSGTDPAVARRLFDLGFAPGVEVEMLRRAPLADPVIFQVAGYEIALRRAQASCIQVSPLLP